MYPTPFLKSKNSCHWQTVDLGSAQEALPSVRGAQEPLVVDVALPLLKTWPQPGQDAPSSDGSRSGPPAHQERLQEANRKSPTPGKAIRGSLGFPGTRCLGKSWGALAPGEWVWRQEPPVLAWPEPET